MAASATVVTSPQQPPQDRRASERKQVSVDLRLKASSLSLPLSSRTVDISSHDAFIRSPKQLSVGAVVTVELDRGPLRNPLTLEAEVVRIGNTHEGRPSGFAVRFRDVGELEENLLQDLIDEASSRQ